MKRPLAMLGLAAFEALEEAIGRLGDVPVDIRPIYRQADELAPAV